MSEKSRQFSLVVDQPKQRSASTGEHKNKRMPSADSFTEQLAQDYSKASLALLEQEDRLFSGIMYEELAVLDEYEKDLSAQDQTEIVEAVQKKASQMLEIDNLSVQKFISRHVSAEFSKDINELRSGFWILFKSFTDNLTEDLKKSLENSESRAVFLKKFYNIQDRWNAYMLLLSDLCQRGKGVDKVYVPEVDQDKKIGKLVKSIKWLIGGHDGGYHVTNKGYLPNPAELEITGIDENELDHLKISTPHGVIFHNLLNRLNTVLKFGARNQVGGAIKFTIEKSDDQLIFTMFDNSQHQDINYSSEAGRLVAAGGNVREQKVEGQNKWTGALRISTKILAEK